jgi:hypothetical protein
MRARSILVAAWLLSGLGAVGGSILGGALGRRGLVSGAVLGGALGAVAAIWLCTRLHWLPSTQRRAATIGAVVGFLIAAPLAAANLHTPVLPVLFCSFAGAGALIGAGRARSTQDGHDPHANQR